MNLIDHPVVSVDLPYHGPPQDVPPFQLVATLHSSMADPVTDPPDLQILVAGSLPTGDHPARHVSFVGAALLNPLSRGQVQGGIDLNYFDDQDDLPRLVEASGRVEATISSAALRKLGGAERLEPRPANPIELHAWIKANVWSYHHPVGTCAMGAVVDAHCRVLGVDGLSVVDASVMPDIPSANTNIPTIMIAERVALLRREHAPKQASAPT